MDILWVGSDMAIRIVDDGEKDRSVLDRSCVAPLYSPQVQIHSHLC